METQTPKQKLICWIAYLFTRLFHGSYRYHWYGLEHYEAARLSSQSGYPVIACWHQNALASVLAHAYRRLGIVVSRSFDGEIISSVAARFGIASARGSSHRGGLEALRDIVKLIKSGHEAGITVDGPTGPLHQVKPGVISIASLTGSTVLPFLAVGMRYWSFSSWDRFRLAKPFTHIVCIYGPPIAVPRRMEKSEQAGLAKELEVALTKLEDQAASWRAQGSAPPPAHKGLRPNKKVDSSLD